ncbi:membrane-spanning 4-domains subfamily A member 4D-like [Acanthopagrus latus]|uniref:membrane-spanning 4-domains subfamily A member 4D-like n=1 Tax=Acanthopagrus latus TaxID=8177 RepID=UPI00187CE302|nr:membrane-spanning 4-domains subfamily A member 4D-like [Acanthopagrus latus]
MEGTTESTTRERTTGNAGKSEANQTTLMSGKPLHRFVQREPRCLGIALVVFGCAEVLMGFHLAGENQPSSSLIYIPFWQGILFLACGNLSIYTEIHPSKKMVTVCLAMYVVSLLGIIVSAGFRIYCLTYYSYLNYRARYSRDPIWATYRMSLLTGIESLLFVSSLCVSGLLIFLCVIARLALKSTRTQLIVQHLPLPQNVGTSN